ncbi:hypothetical protein PCL_08348 [Purpureocillium lilacinum]|uniref:Uncharacterized protein n=1 Tax=Purpureocillium lilacinum TaxID=33203 RepID=A0A2U3DRX0_PURLI|nr:hypothetical protein PCL_08348 [Purpureocillium lilacinum]
MLGLAQVSCILFNGGSVPVGCIRESARRSGHVQGFTMTQLHWLATAALAGLANSAIFGHRLAHLADFRLYGAPGCFDDNLGIWTVIEGDVKPGDCRNFNGNTVFSLSNVVILEGCTLYAYMDENCTAGEQAIPEGECASVEETFRAWGMSCHPVELR